MTILEAADLIAQLRPAADLKVMDLVAEAGIDVGPWSVKHRGQPVANPRANPNYCYEWAFGEGGEPIVLCVWHASLTPHAHGVAYQGNLRARAKLLEDIMLDRKEAADTRSRAKNQAKRCDAFDFRVQRAVRNSLPLRVILLEGDRADRLGHDASKVRRRLLDDSTWHVHDYDFATGAFTLLRGAPMAVETPPKVDRASDHGNAPYVDQFSVQTAERREHVSHIFARSEIVRRNVLQRAAGRCEHCGREGFLMASGQIYLETHHVIPLCEDGPDIESNVAALCPEDHRKAHFSVDADDIRSALLALLRYA